MAINDLLDKPGCDCVTTEVPCSQLNNMLILSNRDICVEVNHIKKITSNQ